MKKQLWILELFAIVAIFGAGIMALSAVETAEATTHHAATTQSPADSSSHAADDCETSQDARQLVLAEKTEDGGCPYMKAKSEGKADCPHKAKSAGCDCEGTDCASNGCSDCPKCAKAKSGDCPYKAKNSDDQSES